MDVDIYVLRLLVISRCHKLMREGHWCLKGRGRVQWGFLWVHVQLRIVLPLPFEGLPGSGRSPDPLGTMNYIKNLSFLRRKNWVAADCVKVDVDLANLRNLVLEVTTGPHAGAGYRTCSWAFTSKLFRA